MLARGSMRDFKKVLGLILGGIGLFLLTKPEVVLQNSTLSGIALLVASYFLVIAGRRW